MSALTLERLLFDATAPTDGPLIGAYILGADGTVINDTGTSLDVNITNASIAVTATDLDIRDLDSAQDSVEIATAAGQALSIDGSGFITANINGTVTVTATDLDIRDLVNTQDSIAIGDETNLVDLQQNDAAFGASAYGFAMFGIRQDASGSPVSADGDAHPLVFNDDGELKVAADLQSSVADDAADSGNPIKIGGRGLDQSSALSALSAANDRFDLVGDLYRRVFINDAPNIGASSATVTVGTTEVALPTTALAGRTRMIIQNRGTKGIHVGPTGVTTASGLGISKGGSLTLEIGEAVSLFGISSAAGQDVRVFELA